MLQWKDSAHVDGKLRRKNSFENENELWLSLLSLSLSISNGWKLFNFYFDISTAKVLRTKEKLGNRAMNFTKKKLSNFINKFGPNKILTKYHPLGHAMFQRVCFL